MTISYIILAHKQPKQLRRLINRLNAPWVKFYVHIDRNNKLQPFQNELRNLDNLYFLNDEERFPGIWGDIGIVKGTLGAMSLVVDQNSEGYCILITGQDYPLRTNSEIRSFLEKKPAKNFISIYQTPDSWKGHFKERICKYKVNKSSNRGHFLLISSIFDKDFYKKDSLGQINYLIKTGKTKALKRILKRRKFPKIIKPYGGGVYFALPIRTIKNILAFHNDNPEFLKFNEYTLCADEVFFHSIIMHVKEKKEIDIAPSLTYANWNRPNGPLPVTFKVKDFEEIKKASENYLFARKFDIEIDERILDKCDEVLLK